MEGQIPVVSVIIPTYNQAALLQKALMSVINQTFQNWEAIVIDNHSEDDTKRVTESFNDTRIRYEVFSNNGVIAASRNHGIHLARGDTIAFLDSDDLWYPSKLSVCLDYVQKGADAVCHGLVIREDGIILKNKFTPELLKKNLHATLLFEGNSFMATSAVVIKKKCFDLYGVFSEDKKFVTAEDYELWLRFTKNGIRWEFIPDVLGEYTVHGKNASGNVEKQMRAEEEIVVKYFKEICFPGASGQVSYRKRRVILVFRAGVRVWRTGDRLRSIPYFFRGLSRIFL